MCKDAGLRQRFAEREWNRDDITDGEDQREASLQRVPVHRNPASLAGEGALADNARRAVRWNVCQEVEFRIRAVRKNDSLGGRVNRRHLMFGMVRDALS